MNENKDFTDLFELLYSDTLTEEDDEKLYEKLKYYHNKAYSNINNWNDLCDVNVEFLEGKHPVSFYSYGQLHSETTNNLNFLNNIIKLNKNYILTINSQPSIVSKREKQKSYIHFYCQQDIANKILLLLQNNHNIYFSYNDYSNNIYIDNFPNEIYGLTSYSIQEPLIFYTNWHRKYYKKEFNYSSHIYCNNKKNLILNLIHNSVSIFITGREFKNFFSAPNTLCELINL